MREPLRRTVEYVLGLSTLDRIKRRNALRDEMLEIGRLWALAVERAREAVAAYGWRTVDLPDSPTSSSQRHPARILVRQGDDFIPLSVAVEEWKSELDELEGEQVTLAGERTGLSREQLEEAERELRRLGAAAREAQEALNLGEADLDAVAARLAVVENDKRRLRDVQRLRALGSTLEILLLSSAQCPTCEQDLDGRQVATGEALTVEETAALADAERQKLVDLRKSLESRVRALRTVADAVSRDLADARNRIRLLRDELAGPCAAPSYAEVERRLSLKAKLIGSERVIGTVEAVDEELDSLAAQLDDVRARLFALGDAVDSPEDVATVAEFRARFREQLTAYGLRSLPPEEVTIDETTLLPVNDGLELVFDVSTGMSASDTIRTKWAYYAALLEVATRSSRGHHTGLLILDEPRQQETDRASLAAFLRRLGADAETSQILYATSERPEVLSELLTNIRHIRLEASGAHLLVERNA